jgi:Clp amino terminal domain, pathogenicity island component
MQQAAGTLQSVFERFTDRARRVLVLAQEEARLLNHSYIGTEHLLLGLIHENDGVAAKALRSVGVSLEAVRVRVEETVRATDKPPNGSPPFTARAKKVLELGLREALQLGHSYIGTEHLLLGLVREGDGVGVTVLLDLGADLDRVRQSVIHLMSGQVSEPDAAAWVREESGSPSISRRATAGPDPRCPQCSADLKDVARIRMVVVPPESETLNVEPVPMDAVYCSRCGLTLHMFRSDSRNAGTQSDPTKVADPATFPDIELWPDGAIADEGSVNVDLIYRSEQLSGMVGEAAVDLFLNVPRHVGEAKGDFAGHELAVQWVLGNNYYDHPDVAGTVAGTFAGRDFTLTGTFHLDLNYAIERARIHGGIGGEPITAQLNVAVGGLSTTRTVAIDGTFAGTGLSILATISGDLTRGHIRGDVDGHDLLLDAIKDQEDQTTTIKGTYGGPPALLALTVGTFLYFM